MVGSLVGKQKVSVEMLTVRDGKLHFISTSTYRMVLCAVCCADGTEIRSITSKSKYMSRTCVS